MIGQQTSVTRIVLLTLVLVTTIVLSAFGLANYYHERTVRLEELHTKLHVIAGQLSSSLTLPMWNFDFEQVNKIIESTMQNREIFGVVVREAGQAGIVSAYARDTEWHTVSTKSDIPKAGLLFDSVSITFNGKEVGTATVFMTPKFMNESLLLFLLITLASVIVLNICLVFILFQLLNRTVISPLRAIEGYTLKVSAGEPEGVLIHKARFFGELENLRRSVVEMTRSLVSAQQALVRKEKMTILGQLAGIVGHEIRNPLGVMSNAVYFLKTVLPDADDMVKEYLDIIKQEIDNSQRIITDLLDFARTKTPQMTPITVSTLVAQALGKCTIPENIDVQTDIPGTLPRLNVDPFQMGQVLQNLITNAVQAMPKGGALTISARRGSGVRNQSGVGGQGSGVRKSEPGYDADQQFAEPTLKEDVNEGVFIDPRSPASGPCSLIPDPCFIEISVSDTGEGISDENMEKLFSPLFTTKTKGIGLGLVVCKNLVEANGGRIEVESKLGEGTTFTFTLPFEKGRE